MQIQRELTTKSVKYYYPSNEKDFLSISWCGEFECKKNFFIARSKVDFTVAIFTVSGVGKLEKGGKFYSLTPGTLALLDSGENYKYYPLNDGWRFKFVHFHGSAVPNLVGEINKVNSPVFQFADKKGLFSALIECARNKESEKKVSSLVSEFFLSAYYGETEEKNSCVQKAKDFVLNNISGDLSVNAIASAVNLSRPYFTQLFTLETGKTPSEFVSSERLKRAKELLFTTDKPISEIALICGYSDVSSFIRFFKRNEKKSPSSLRKNLPYL